MDNNYSKKSSAKNKISNLTLTAFDCGFNRSMQHID
jgi:hypothetical protein